MISQFRYINSGLGPVYGFEEKKQKSYTPTLNKIKEKLSEFTVDPTLSGISLEASDFISTLSRNQDVLTYLQKRIKDEDVNLHSPSFERKIINDINYVKSNYELCLDMNVGAKHFKTSTIQNSLDFQVEKFNELLSGIRQKNPILANKLHQTLELEKYVEKLNDKIRDADIFSDIKNKVTSSIGMRR